METKRNSWNIFSFSFRLWLEQLNGCFFWSTCVTLKSGEGRNCPKSTSWNKGKKPWDKKIKGEKKKDFPWRTEKCAAFSVETNRWLCSTPKSDYLFSLQAIFRGEAEEYAWLDRENSRIFQEEKTTTLDWKVEFFRGFCKEMFQIYINKKKGGGEGDKAF